MRYWDDGCHSYLEAEVVWSGALHRTDEASYSLLGSGWHVKESVLQKAAPPRHSYPSKKEITRAKLVTVNDGVWRNYQPDRVPPPEPRPNPVRLSCRACGRQFKTRIPSRRWLCKACVGRLDGPTAA